MNIGIDIDNTLTDIESDMFEAGDKYTKIKNKVFVKLKFEKYDGITNMDQFYSNIFGWNEKDILFFFRNDRTKVVDNVKFELTLRKLYKN